MWNGRLCPVAAMYARARGIARAIYSQNAGENFQLYTLVTAPEMDFPASRLLRARTCLCLLHWSQPAGVVMDTDSSKIRSRTADVSLRRFMNEKRLF